MATPRRRLCDTACDGLSAPCTEKRSPGGVEKSRFVSAAVRVRPAPPAASVVLWVSSPTEDCGRRIRCDRGHILEEYEFSRVLGPEDGNRRLFAELQGPALAASVLAGVNETLFAYGQTGSGKTHTIFGAAGEPGLLQLSVHAVFEEASCSPGSTVHACCYEVLGDSLTDLVDPQGLMARGELFEQDVVYDELFLKTQKFRYQIVHVADAAVCLDLLRGAHASRTVGASSCNACSSRSHAVVHLFVQNPNLGAGTGVGALTLVDLAGAEKEHENPSEQGRKSARLLNTSLSSLNRLLRKLQTNSLEESERRQSVLNRCLWEYLRPGCGVSMIFCVSPLAKHRATTLSTLAMALDSKSINCRRHSRIFQAQTPVLGSGRRVSSQPRGHTGPGRPVSPGRGRPVSPGLPRSPCEDGTSSPCMGRGRARTPEFAPTPRTQSCPGSTTCSVSSSLSQTKVGAEGLDWAKAESGSFLQRLVAEDAQALQKLDILSPTAVASLALQNKRLRRKLSRTRVRSRERAGHAEKACTKLNEENALLRQECESLRETFIRQQRQQISFWTGPFMQMIESSTVPGGAGFRGLDVPGGLGNESCLLDSSPHLSRVTEGHDALQSLQFSLSVAEDVQETRHRELALCGGGSAAERRERESESPSAGQGSGTTKGATSGSGPQESSEESSWLQSTDPGASAPESECSRPPISDCGSEWSTKSFLVDRRPRLGAAPSKTSGLRLRLQFPVDVRDGPAAVD